jgi:hypothetical protein
LKFRIWHKEQTEEAASRMWLPHLKELIKRENLEQMEILREDKKIGLQNLHLQQFMVIKV